MAASKLTNLAGLAGLVADGASLAIPGDDAAVAMAATRALIRRGVRGLHLVTVPVSGLQADLLIGAGCVRSLEVGGVTLGEHGLAPRFRHAVESGSVAIRDATCPAILTGLTAAEKGVPFLPIRGILGSDLLRHRPDWRIIDNPFADGGDPLVLVPAIAPDVTLFHAPLADRRGNVWIGTRRELMTMAHAARATLVTADEVVDGDLLADPKLAPGVVPHPYVTAVAEAKGGAWPLWPADDAHLRLYAGMARTPEGFADYLERFG